MIQHYSLITVCRFMQPLLQYNVHYCNTVCITAAEVTVGQRIRSDSIRLNLIISLKNVWPPPADKQRSSYCRLSL